MSNITRRNLLNTGLQLGAAAGLGALGVGSPITAPAIAQNAKISARLSHDLSADDPYNIGSLKFAELVSNYTNGDLKIQVFPNHVLSTEPESVRQMRAGSLDMALVGGNLPTVDPRWTFGALPYIFKSYEGADKVFEGDVGKEALSMLSEFGMVGLSYFTNGYRHVTNSRQPIVEPKDMAGLKIRVPQNEAWIATFKALGANPTPMDFGQLYMALKTKVVDAQEGAPSVIYTLKFFEGQEYLSLTGHIFQPVPLIVSQKFWEKLPQDMKGLVQKAAIEAGRFERGLVKTTDLETIEKLKAVGMKVNEINKQAFVTQTQPVYEELQNKIPSLAAIVNKVRAAQS
jgi:tripartite ATP-independent transporter DctP family solute receptor